MIIVSPLHSVTSPTVGVGYLAAETKAIGFSCPIRDLNIGLLHHLKDAGVSQNWLEWIFPFGQRTYGGELLLAQACFDISTAQVLDRARSIESRAFHDFLAARSLETWLLADEASEIRCLLQSYLNSSSEYLISTAQDWIGFSVIATNQPTVIFLIEALSRHRPDLPVILGGPHFTRSNALAWATLFPSVDAVVVGDGRGPLLGWLTGTEQPYARQIVRSGSSMKSIRMNTPGSRLPWKSADWSDIQWSAYRNIFDDARLYSTHQSSGAAVPIVGARGCSYNKCTFCYEVLLTPRFEPRCVTEIVDEISTQRDATGQSDFFLTDLDLNSDYQRTLDLAAEIRTRVPGIRFHCWLRAHELDETTLEALYNAGARTWFVGIEAIVDGPLQRMRKGYTADHARHVIRTMARFSKAHPDVRYGFNLITNFPGETMDEVTETFRVIADNADEYLGKVSCLFDFTLTSNTIVWLQREQMGLRNVVGWNEILLPRKWSQLPSHRYWYDCDSPSLLKRRLIWDHIRVLVGHEPHYISYPGQHTQVTSVRLPIAE